MAYRPLPGVLPVPLVVQDAKLFPKVLLKDVLPPGHPRACKTFSVKVFPGDAELALKIASGTVGRLQAEPYRLEVATVDHTGNSACSTSHDILMNTRVGGESCLPVGLYSVEIRCRSVGSKTAFPWETTLSSECMPLWIAELQTDAKQRCRLQGRILVFACCMVPCPTGAMSLHGSINNSNRDDGWSRLFGWTGFSFPKAKQEQPFATIGGLAAGAAPKAAPRVSNAPANVAQAASVQWQKKQAKLEAVGGEWVKL